MDEIEEELGPKEKTKRDSFPQTTEEVARAVVEAAKAVRPPPSIVFSSNSSSGTGGNRTLENLQRHITRVWRQGFSKDIKKGFFNPEHLTSQKRQWMHLQMQILVRSSLTLLLHHAESVCDCCLIHGQINYFLYIWYLSQSNLIEKHESFYVLFERQC